MEPSAEIFAVLRLDFGSACAVTLAHHVDSFESATSASQQAESLDLDAALQLTRVAVRGHERKHTFLHIGSGKGGRITYRTTAAVRIAEIPAADLFRLPRMLREGGCAPWLRGFAVFPGATQNVVAPWFDLAAMR